MEATELGQVSTAAAEVYEAFFVPALFAQFAGPVADAAAHRRRAGGARRRLRHRRAGARGFAGAPGRAAGSSVSTATPGCWRSRGGRRRESTGAKGWPRRCRSPTAASTPSVSQFGLMFFEDRRAALAEMWRVLRPGGRLVVAVWDAAERSPGYARDDRAGRAAVRREGRGRAAGAVRPRRCGRARGGARCRRDAGSPDRDPGGHRALSVDRRLGADRREGLDAGRPYRRRRLRAAAGGAAREELGAFAGRRTGASPSRRRPISRWRRSLREPGHLGKNARRLQPSRPGPEPGQRPTAPRAAASRPPAVAPLPSSRADAGFGTASPITGTEMVQRSRWSCPKVQSIGDTGPSQ